MLVLENEQNNINYSALVTSVMTHGTPASAQVTSVIAPQRAPQGFFTTRLPVGGNFLSRHTICTLIRAGEKLYISV